MIYEHISILLLGLLFFCKRSISANGFFSLFLHEPNANLVIWVPEKQKVMKIENADH